jgi:hypothetical protein
VTVPTTIDAGAWLGKFLEASDADTDLPRAMLAAFAEVLMSAQASMQCNAAYGERTDERENSRNGYRVRPWDTRVGTVDLAIPKLRQGVYSPEFLLQPRRRAEQALIAVVYQAYVEGVSTRRVDDLVKAMGIEGISKSEVSRMAAELDQKVAEFRDRPLDAGPYRYLWIDALTQRVREGGRVVNDRRYTLVYLRRSTSGHWKPGGRTVVSPLQVTLLQWMVNLRSHRALVGTASTTRTSPTRSITRCGSRTSTSAFEAKARPPVAHASIRAASLTSSPMAVTSERALVLSRPT